jgi:biopolymer transport protein ExbB/TolQ
MTQSAHIRRLVISLVLMVAGPIVGLGWTVLSLQGAIDQADSSQKAQMLAEGIHQGMLATAIGLGVGALGAILFVIFLVIWLVNRPAKPTSASTSGSPQGPS